MLQQLWDDATDTFLIESNGVIPEWGYNQFSTDSIVINENCITSIIAELSQDAQCKRALSVLFILTDGKNQRKISFAIALPV